jgi:hypothetical protein
MLVSFMPQGLWRRPLVTLTLNSYLVFGLRLPMYAFRSVVFKNQNLCEIKQYIYCIFFFLTFKFYFHFLNESTKNCCGKKYYICTSFRMSFYFCDGCNSYDRDLLEEIQVCTAQIITGLTSRNSLYLETVFEPLISRRKTAKLVT